MRLHGRAWLGPALALVVAGAACSSGSGSAAQPSKPAAPASGAQPTAGSAPASAASPPARDNVSIRLGLFQAGPRQP